MDEEFLESGVKGIMVTPGEMDIMFSHVSGAAKDGHIMTKENFSNTDGYQEIHSDRSVRYIVPSSISSN